MDILEAIGDTSLDNEASRGVATVLKRQAARIRAVAVEPAESSVLLGGPPGPHKIEGVGVGYAPPLWDPGLFDEIVPVPTAEAKAMARRLGPGATVVTLMAESGLKYLSTDVYRSEPEKP